MYYMRAYHMRQAGISIFGPTNPIDRYISVTIPRTPVFRPDYAAFSKMEKPDLPVSQEWGLEVAPL